MKRDLHDFFLSARGICLTESEKRAVHEKLRFAVRKRLDVRLDHQMEKNPLFSSAHNIVLSPEERRELKHQLFTAMGRKQLPMSPETLRALTRSAKSISLSPAEHVHLKEGLFEAIGRNRSPFWSPLRALSSIMAAVLVVTFVGGGATYAAESALPGDFLYAVKVHINEPFLARLATSSEEKARFAAFRADRRLREAEELAGKSALQGERKNIERRFKEHIASMNAEVAKLLVAGELEAAGRVAVEAEAAMQAHVNVMEGMKDKEGIGVLIETAHAARIDAEKAAIAASADEEAFLGLTGEAVTNAIRSAEKNIGHSKGEGSAAANARLEGAKKSLEAGAEGAQRSDVERIRHARSALRKAKEASLMLELKTKANADVSGSEDEDAADIGFTTSVQLKMAEDELKDIEKKLSRHPDITVVTGGRVETHVGGSKQLMDIANTQMREGNVSEALEASAEALRQAKAAKKELKEIEKR